MKPITTTWIMPKAVAIAVASLVMLVTSSAASPSQRAAERRYSMSNGMVAGSSEAYWQIGTEFKVFKARPGERRVVFSIVDEAGPNVRGHIHTDVDGDGDVDHEADFCSESEPIAVRPGQRIEVAVLLGECPDGEPSVVTEGTITATFSR